MGVDRASGGLPTPTCRGSWGNMCSSKVWAVGMCGGGVGLGDPSWALRSHPTQDKENWRKKTTPFRQEMKFHCAVVHLQ